MFRLRALHTPTSETAKIQTAPVIVITKFYAKISPLAEKVVV